MYKLIVAVAATLMVAGCANNGSYGNNYDPPGNYRAYDYDRPDPSYGGYDPSRYYRDEPRYGERRLAEQDRIYRGGDGRYYCRRSDGTTGLIVGAIAGGVLGNAIAPGDSKTLGTILGAGAGALAGQAIDRNNVRCR